MNKATKACERMMNERGYVVVCFIESVEVEAGVTAIPSFSGTVLSEPYMLIIRCETDKADYDAQLNLLLGKEVRSVPFTGEPEVQLYFRATLTEDQ